MRRIALFSDIHGNLEALNSILKYLESNSYDEIICLGDVVGLGPSSHECLELMKNSNIRYLLGNHERALIDENEMNALDDDRKLSELWVKDSLNTSDIQYLKSLDMSYELLEKGKLFLFSHFAMIDGKYLSLDSSLEELNDIFLNISADYFFFGHEHNPFSMDVCSRHFESIGSSGCNDSKNTFLTEVTIDDYVYVKKVILDYDRKKFEKTLRSIDYPYKKDIANKFFGILL